MTDEHQGLLNFWLTRHTPEIARWVGSYFQKHHDDKRIAHVTIRQALKRLPGFMLTVFATEYCPIADVVHVWLGHLPRYLPQ